MERRERRDSLGDWGAGAATRRRPLIRIWAGQAAVAGLAVPAPAATAATAAHGEQVPTAFSVRCATRISSLHLTDKMVRLAVGRVGELVGLESPAYATAATGSTPQTLSTSSTTAPRPSTYQTTQAKMDSLGQMDRMGRMDKMGWRSL